MSLTVLSQCHHGVVDCAVRLLMSLLFIVCSRFHCVCCWLYAADVTVCLLLTVYSGCVHVFVVDCAARHVTICCRMSAVSVIVFIDCVQLVWLFAGDCVQLVWQFLLLTVCNWWVFSVNSVQQMWSCICCWLCAVCVTVYVVDLCAAGMTVFVVDCVQSVWHWQCMLLTVQLVWQCMLLTCVQLAWQCLLLTVCSLCDCVCCWLCSWHDSVCCWLCAVCVTVCVVDCVAGMTVFVFDCVQQLGGFVVDQCDHVFVVDHVQLVWPCIYCWLCAVHMIMYLLLTVCSRCDHILIVYCVQLVCCWLCAVDVTIYLLLTVCSWCDHVFIVDCVQSIWSCIYCWLCAVNVTMYLLLTVCSWCDHVFIVDCVETIWSCIYCWLCAVDVTRENLLIVDCVQLMWPCIYCWLCVGRTSLSLALGNMVVTRQMLLIFNLSYLLCFVQFVNKNYCHAKNDLFTTCWCHYFVREWCIASLEEVLMNTPSSQKPSVVLTSKVRWARLENGCIRKTVGNFYKKNVQTWSYNF